MIYVLRVFQGGICIEFRTYYTLNGAKSAAGLLTRNNLHSFQYRIDSLDNTLRETVVETGTKEAMHNVN